MKIEKGKAEKLIEIKRKLDPGYLLQNDKYLFDENKNHIFKETEVTNEELMFLLIEQSRIQLLISKTFLWVFIIIPIVVTLFLLIYK